MYRLYSMLVPMLLLVFTVAGAPAPVAAAGEVNIYSARQEALIKPLLDRFTEQSGIKVNLVAGRPEALLQRLQSEGRNSPADLLLTVDAGNLNQAMVAGVFQPVESAVLNEVIPVNLRDPEGHWFGLSQRARVIIYAKDRFDPAGITSYADLADPALGNKICIRSSANVYNQSLVASRIAHLGVEATEEWVRGLMANLARPPRGGDRDQIRAVAAGQCDLAVVNTYYIGGMANGSEADQDAVAATGLIWPDQEGYGTHINVSGAGVAKYARNRDNAVKLLEFLVSEEAQSWYASANYEFPVRPGVELSDTLAAWGEFRADDLDLARLGEYNPEAVRLMDRAGWR
ncbi:Fe(3+) ABC transporter substrate-binding protein [Desulfurivibrio alkaliphilus]|uniref:Extracellular solute-binding protein family 1 n=1 Tax=Desulfurivibrio alkaliphilus (strain DSM 19089 / UNIQEM U267 / AHT2) TaxID=589865 RepID=D6Z6C4_DESAT|nr:Fe(3+) ABC transporter substrate-binding protein [Desulfurivibrio alkaliphilus]ADH86889.1 extracellular solute-binding protein family 1 [Desulfurivibrio alkaliphilus AHT 2]